MGLPSHRHQGPPSPGLCGGSRPGPTKQEPGQHLCGGTGGVHRRHYMGFPQCPEKGTRMEEVREQRRRLHREKRWVLKKLDLKALEVSLLASTWAEGEADLGAEEEAERLCDAMSRACDASMPRSRPMARCAAYWWSTELAKLKRATVAARRAYTRARRRGVKAVTEESMAVLRDYKKALRTAIARSKVAAWEDLVSKLDRDPWGRPYKIVRKRLRAWAPPVTETVEPQFLNRVVDTLFPIRGRDIPEKTGPPPDWREELGVSNHEMAAVFARIKGQTRAPGPDGIYAKCLREETSLRRWKRARLVLLKKEGKPAESPSAYKLLCMLDDAGKLFERIKANRIIRHLSREGPNLSPGQYGFREARSTIDAVLMVRSLSAAIMGDGKVELAISLDIVNAFNSIPWGRVVEALEEYHLVPPYLVSIIRDYFRDRKLEFRDKKQTLAVEGHVVWRSAGVSAWPPAMERRIQRNAPYGPSPWLPHDRIRGRHISDGQGGKSPGEELPKWAIGR
ncbi:uncharacterized protein LOC105200637 [Solenopsis invicta]|uniref:uncharacterized protein LOC105200637 n=1 Tax=Solenopsis invicta TaxID=13686 RepID=UPI0005961FB9|nr:uncharacterized protein LOC105200637 [Solenopsis invicta]